MKNEVKKEFLSYDALKSMMDEHTLYTSTDGKRGKEADLGGYVIEDFDFSGFDLNSINARESMFIRCRFVGCDLSGVHFNHASLIEADFRDAYLWKANFSYAIANGACFDRADVGDVEFDETQLRAATFRNANLRGASIIDCDLSNAVFDGADLEYTSFVDNKEDGTSWVNVKGRSAASPTL